MNESQNLKDYSFILNSMMAPQQNSDELNNVGNKMEPKWSNINFTPRWNKMITAASADLKLKPETRWGKKDNYKKGGSTLENM